MNNMENILAREVRAIDLADAARINDKEPQAVAEKKEAAATPTNGSALSQYVAKMPVERYAMEYNMNHKNRGKALIFNHEFFSIPSLKQRAGTNIDCENLRSCFSSLGFEVSEHKDCSFNDMLEIFKKVSAEDHTDNDCLAIIILSHGEQGYVFASDTMYKLDSISHYFTAISCPTLAGKPKLFFIQACQGDRLDPGVQMMQRTETDSDATPNYKIPAHADFLYAFSTISGFYSWRNSETGSWFIQALVKELNANGKKQDLLTLLTFVLQYVSIDYETHVPESPMMHKQKQIPCITTMLTRILRFNEKLNNNLVA